MQHNVLHVQKDVKDAQVDINVHHALQISIYLLDHADRLAHLVHLVTMENVFLVLLHVKHVLVLQIFVIVA